MCVQGGREILISSVPVPPAFSDGCCASIFCEPTVLEGKPQSWQENAPAFHEGHAPNGLIEMKECNCT